MAVTCLTSLDNISVPVASLQPISQIYSFPVNILLKYLYLDRVNNRCFGSLINVALFIGPRDGPSQVYPSCSVNLSFASFDEGPFANFNFTSPVNYYF